MMNRTLERQYWTDFINIYQSKPVLWKYGSDIYKDRNLKREAYKVLVEKMKEIEPKADIDMVKRKINSLRACYRRELAKVRKLRKAGTPENGPRWIYFDNFAFLNEQKDPLEGEYLNYTTEKDDDEEEEEDDQSEENEVGEEVRYHTRTPSPLPGLRLKQRMKRSISPNPNSRSDFVELACKQYKQTNDDADILSIGWAMQYRDLNKEQKLYAKKAIDDILFEAKLETLHRHSVKINENICSNCAGQQYVVMTEVTPVPNKHTPSYG